MLTHTLGSDGVELGRPTSLAGGFFRLFTGCAASRRNPGNCAPRPASPGCGKARVFAAIQGFADFTADNDPYGEHDFALLRPEGLRVIFKIDYYNPTLSGHSPDPTEPQVTRRVLTIMLAEEY